MLLSSDSVEVVDPESNALARRHAEVEKALKSAAFDTTVLRPATFATMTLGWASFIRSGVPVEQASWEARLDIIHPEDIADVAQLALENDEFGGSIIGLGGPEMQSFNGYLRVLEGVLGRHLEYQEPSRERAAAQLADHVPKPLIHALLEYWERLPRHDGKANRSAERFTGRPGRTFHQWATSQLAFFR